MCTSLSSASRIHDYFKGQSAQFQKQSVLLNVPQDFVEDQNEAPSRSYLVFPKKGKQNWWVDVNEVFPDGYQEHVLRFLPSGKCYESRRHPKDHHPGLQAVLERFAEQGNKFLYDGGGEFLGTPRLEAIQPDATVLSLETALLEDEVPAPKEWRIDPNDEFTSWGKDDTNPNVIVN